MAGGKAAGVSAADDHAPIICVEMGTTNTRAWLVRGDEVLACESRPAGVRDTARDGSPQRIRAALREMIAALRAHGAASCMVGAGMIGSALGLLEVPHVPGPAGLPEIAEGARWFQFPQVAAVPILIVPGVKTASPSDCSAKMPGSDVMRGEETACLGLIALGTIRAPALVLNLGSHWKAIRVDAAGRIAASVTSLSGELLHAAQTQTILASAVPQERPARIFSAWTRRGMKEERRAGLGRALFCVRLLELEREGAPEQRLSFMAGAFIAAELDALVKLGVLRRRERVAITGGGSLAVAWRAALADAGIQARTIGEAARERGLLAGLRRILGCVPRR